MWKKLATPFVKIWDWIKETAWIQPLLIVGIVFGIIFSISPLVSWIQGILVKQWNTIIDLTYH